MKLILLNGPPQSGKDFALRELRHHFSPRLTFRHDKFSIPIKLAFAALMQKQISRDGHVAYYEDNKEEIIPTFGISYRQWQIDFSEKFMKPLYGQTIFAKLLLQRQELRRETPNYLCIVSDCGFQVEADTILQNWSPDDVLLIRLNRFGCDFSKDSREYVYRKDSGGSFKIIYNTGDRSFTTTLIETVEKFLAHT